MLKRMVDVNTFRGFLGWKNFLTSAEWEVQEMQPPTEQGLIAVRLKVKPESTLRKEGVKYEVGVVFFRCKGDELDESIWLIHSWAPMPASGPDTRPTAPVWAVPETSGPEPEVGPADL